MTETAAAADAVEAAAEAAEAAAEAAEAVADAARETAADEPPPPTPAAPANPEGAHDDEVQLDHEQRLTRVEDALAVAVAAIGERPTYEEVRNMTPNTGEVIDTAAAVARETTQQEIAEHEDEEHGDNDGDGDEGEPAEEVEIVEPEAPPVEEGAAGSRRRGFVW